MIWRRTLSISTHVSVRPAILHKPSVVFHLSLIPSHCIGNLNHKQASQIYCQSQFHSSPAQSCARQIQSDRLQRPTPSVPVTPASQEIKQAKA
jgi:hypothetical protein